VCLTFILLTRLAEILRLSFSGSSADVTQTNCIFLTSNIGAAIPLDAMIVYPREVNTEFEIGLPLSARVDLRRGVSGNNPCREILKAGAF
jgi:hypothetical protein